MDSPALRPAPGLLPAPPVPPDRLGALADAMGLSSPSADTPPGQDAVLRDSSRLRGLGHSPEAAAWALTQRAFRAAAAPKFGRHAESSLYTRAGLEQASRRELAEHHARLLREAGATAVVDAGCGLGADSLAFLDAGLDVVALEIDPETASLTAFNLASHPRGDRAEVWVADVMEILASPLLQQGGPWAGHAVWFDPARRESGASGRRRVFDPEEFSPPLSAISAFARSGSGSEPARVVAAKLGPALDAAQVPERFDVEWITHRQDTSEAVIVAPSARPSLIATRITSEGGLHEMRRERRENEHSADAADLAAEIAAGDILWEPVGSVLRAGFVQDLALELDADLLSADIAYVLSSADSTARPESHPLATGYRVRETLPLHPKQMKSWVKANGITELTIKKRGVDIDPAALRKQLLAGAGKGPRKTATLILTRHGSGRVCIVADPAT